MTESAAYYEGRDAFYDGLFVNPYTEDSSDFADDWQQGWNDAKEADEPYDGLEWA